MFWVLSLFIFEIFTSLYLCIFYLSIFGIGGCLDCLDCLEGVQGCFFLSHWSHPFSVKTRKNTPPPPPPLPPTCRNPRGFHKGCAKEPLGVSAVRVLQTWPDPWCVKVAGVAHFVRPLCCLRSSLHDGAAFVDGPSAFTVSICLPPTCLQHRPARAPNYKKET